MRNDITAVNNNGSRDQGLDIPRVTTAKSDKQPGHHTISLPKIGSDAEVDSNQIIDNTVVSNVSRVKSHRVTNDSAPRLPSAVSAIGDGKNDGESSGPPDLLFLPRDSAQVSGRDE